MKALLLSWASGCLLLFPSNKAFSQQAGWGAVLEDQSKKVKIGGRIQAIANSDSETESQDFYLRRLRLNIDYKPWDGHAIVYDIRNDNANQGNRGEGGFSIGDAYWKINLKKTWANNIKLFRSKVDVSYSQTSSSKNLFNPDRAEVSEHASDFVVQNRRAANAQLNGNFGRLYYQVALSDGVHSDDLASLQGDVVVDAVNHQKFTYGGKLRYYFVGDAQKNIVQDTFYGKLDTFSLGIGYFANDEINVALSDDRNLNIRRALTNIELSYARKNFRLLAEYFALTGDIIDLSATEKSAILGDSSGYYAQLEYLIGKWAPYIGYENFDRWNEEDGYAEEVNTVGINYYQNLEARRYGLAYKKHDGEKELGDRSSERIYGYFMLNF